ncbi:hypothetical protein ACS0TY_015666 [Phlomoides rotata]
MSNPDAQKVAESPPPAVDLENGAVGGGGVSEIVRRWKREDLLKKCSLASRGLGFVFSFLAFVLMASNKHGDWKDFDKYDEYRYVMAIAILSTLYTGLQSFRQIYQLSTGREVFSGRTIAIVDFCGDQIMAYLLISAASSAVPLTNIMREGEDNMFTDASASAISMEFFAFFVLGFSSLVSGYKLSKQSYI